MNIGKIQNGVNFGMLKIATDGATKEVMHKYVNSMDKARVLSDTFTRIHNETGDKKVIISGKHKDGSIEFTAARQDTSDVLAQVQLAFKEDIDTEKTEEFSQQIIDGVNN